MTLLEVLIALLVLSIGVVGIGVLHLNSIKYAHSSYYTSVATALALDFEERMWIALPQLSGCIDKGAQEEIDAIKDELKDIWGDGNNAEGAVVLPGLEIEAVPEWPAEGTQNAHTDVHLTITWAEGRFNDMDTAIEKFHYRARVICYRGGL